MCNQWGLPEKKGTGDQRGKTPSGWQAREDEWSVSREGNVQAVL